MRRRGAAIGRRAMNKPRAALIFNWRAARDANARADTFYIGLCCVRVCVLR